MLLALLLLGCVASVISSITGVQAFHTDSRTGTVITHWHGYGRLLVLGQAAFFAVAFYGIYRRFPITWKVGFVVLCLGALQFICQAWLMLSPQPYGWVGATAATVFTPLVALYWIRWWRKQRSYFFPDDAEQT